MDRQIIILVAVIALVLLIGVQAYQINGLKNEITSGVIVNPTGQVNPSSAFAKQRSAPTMVGGC